MPDPQPTRAAALTLACLLVACAVVPSRAPLGGNYALPEAAPAADRRATPAASAALLPDAAAASNSVKPAAAPSASLAAAEAGPLAPVATADTIHFEPLQVGSLIKADVTLSASAEMHGAAFPGMPKETKVALDSQLRVEIKVRKLTAQTLDEIELTLTTLSMHVDFAGQASDSKGGAPETYDITLSGSAPSIRATNGSKIHAEDRLKLALFIVPLAEFYAHWARSPSLELKPGWSSKVSLPFAATLFAIGQNETMHVGPLDARFSSRAPNGDELPFELALPVEYATDMGKVGVDLRGSAKLNAKNARPSAFDLSGPLNAMGGPRGAQASVTGAVKFAGSFSYP
ncbi:MAG TPA: hypothetical protein VGJ91_09045 [Polyangiaceae bacterium]|jgi:hypothetical protein